MEHSKTVLYLGGVIKFIPAGSYVDKETGETVNYDSRVRVYPGSREDVVLSIEAVRALYTAIRTDSDLQAFVVCEQM